MFRNLRIFRLQRDYRLELSHLEEALARRPLARCGSFEMVSRGWVFPRQTGAFVHAVGRQWLLALGVEQKLLPATVIRQGAQERIAQIESEQGRKVGRKEARDIAERVTEELMPKAFTCRRTTWGWIDPARRWLVVDAGSDARCDEFIEVLLSTLDEIAPRPLQTQVAPVSAMTGWLAEGESPSGFDLDSDLELRTASAAHAAIRYVHHAIAGPEIVGHISAGKIATRLGLTWNDRISFILTDRLHLKRVTLLDILKEQADQTEGSPEERFDADFALMTGELAQLFDALLQALGGESKPQ